MAEVDNHMKNKQFEFYEWKVSLLVGVLYVAGLLGLACLVRSFPCH